MKSLNLVRSLLFSLLFGLSLTVHTVQAYTPVNQVAAPTLIGYDEPYQISICESEWSTFEFSLDGQTDLLYRWDKFTDSDLLDKFEFSADNTRVRLSDPAGLPSLVKIFLVVQAVDANSCESFPTTVTLILVPAMDIPAGDLDTVCTGRPFIIDQFQNGRIETYDWDFGTDGEELSGDPTDEDPFGLKFNSEGDKTISVAVLDTFGCISEQSYDYVVYDAPPPPNILICPYLGPDSVFFEWTVDDAYDYEMNIVSVPGTAIMEETDTSLLVTGVFPGQRLIIQVSATGDSPAPCDLSAQTAICRSCIPAMLNTDGISRTEFCEGDAGNIAVLLTADVTTLGALQTDPAEGTWLPGPGIVQQGGATFFDPEGLAPGVYDVFYSYVHPDDNCPWDIVIPFTIYERAEPNASFSSTEIDRYEEICSDESIIIHYETYDDRTKPDIFSNISGIDMEEIEEGQERLSFPNVEGTYEIYVRYGLIGCEPLVDTVTVDVSLKPEVIIECGPTETDSIGISWLTIEGTASYEVFLDGVSVAIVNDTIFKVGDLVVDQTYELTVVPLALGCSDSGTIMCNTGGCVSPDLDLTALSDPLCYDPGTGPLNLDVIFTPNRPGFTGSYRWMTPEIDTDNNFTPSPFVEEYTFDIEYTEGNCTEIFQAISFTVITAPEVDLRIFTFDDPDVDTVCFPTSQFSVEASFMAPDQLGSLDYVPIWPAGINPTGQGPGSYLIQVVDGPGSYDIQMQAIYKGCPGPIVTKTLVLEPATEIPMVTCTEGYGEIALDWEPIDCVTAYNVYINIGGQDSLVFSGSSRSFTMPFLEGGLEQIYTVEALTNCRCGNSSFIGNCTPLVCPEILLEEVPLDTCYNPTLAPFEMPIMVTESSLLDAGSGTWAGMLINGNGLVDVSQTNFGGTFELDYTHTQGSCRETITVVLELADAPQIIDIEVLPPICVEDSLGTVIVYTQGGTPDYQYSVNGSAFIAENMVADVGTGVVSVEVVDAAGCSVTDISFMDSSPEPTAEIGGPELIIENNDAFFEILTDLDPDLLENISWFLDGNLVGQQMTLEPFTLEEVSQAGVLSAIVTYGENCELMAVKEFAVNALHSIYIPNIVDLSGRSATPDNEWRAYVKGEESFILEVQVFDRWGNNVLDFENKTMDYFKELLIWDGYYGSVPAKQGVYTYVMKTQIEGIPQIKRGSLTILR